MAAHRLETCNSTYIVVLFVFETCLGLRGISGLELRGVTRRTNDYVLIEVLFNTHVVKDNYILDMEKIARRLTSGVTKLDLSSTNSVSL
jgi:hypothetical protein